jgi:hypothetical protein
MLEGSLGDFHNSTALAGFRGFDGNSDLISDSPIAYMAEGLVQQLGRTKVRYMNVWL